jgi:short-subunit dehydrogenase
MIPFKERYGPTALIAGASEGLGAAWARALAERGLDLVLIARRPEPLAEITRDLTQRFAVRITPLMIDLAGSDAAEKIVSATQNMEIGFLVLNAAASHIGPFIAAGLSTHQGIDVIACCAGATATPHYLHTNPGKGSAFEPRPQLPESVVAECLRRIGTTPSFTSGTANKWAHFVMRYLLPKKLAIRIMGDTLKKMYRIVP